MVVDAWQDFSAELSRWADMGRPVQFWWRDDDACRPEPALSRLIALSSGMGVPLALAVIPETAAPGAFEALPACVAVIQHGTDHMNRAKAGEKKTEFSDAEPAQASLERLLAARSKLEAVTRGRSLPVLAPPWNRLSARLFPKLAVGGYRGISTFGPRKNRMACAGVVQVNTHVDIIDWKGSRGFCGVDSALGQARAHLAARRNGMVDMEEPTGWLTHHAVHDEACWAFLERLFAQTREMRGVVWHSSANLFGSASGT
jgi:hypothetical protein